MNAEKGADGENNETCLPGRQFLLFKLTSSLQNLLTSFRKLLSAADYQLQLFFPPLYCFRQATQDAPEEVRNRDFRRELEERERVAAREKNRDRPTRGKNKVTKNLHTFLWHCSYTKFSVVGSLRVADSMS